MKNNVMLFILIIYNIFIKSNKKRERKFTFF